VTKRTGHMGYTFCPVNRQKGEDVRDLLAETAQAYEERVGDLAHFIRIRDLANALQNEHPTVLAAGRMRIGILQKALNLYLKYLWTWGRVDMPPHCPFDKMVIDAVPFDGMVTTRTTWRPWTRRDSLEEYERLVTAARVVAGTVRLAEWELHRRRTHLAE
jgi:hypothetical protein